MLQKIKSLSLERQLFLSFSAVSALLLMLSLGITLYFDIARQSQSIDSTISSTAAYVASMDGVAEMLANGYPTQEVTGSLDSLHQNFPGIDIIAVYDRNGLRFYHTSRLETGESQKAVQFIMNTSLVTSQSIRETADCIRVSHLCALIIGKMMHAAELGILLTVTHDSFCREEDLLLSPEDYATILGNLLENAIDELSRSHSEVREIKLSMYCRPDCNLVVCEDTGGGIAPDILPHIWDKGFSSKGEGRGFGLYLISRLVDEHGGCIELETEPGVGTCFTLTFTREE